MNLAFAKKGRREEDSQQSDADQHSGQRHDQPQLSISPFELRELLTNLRQNTFSLCKHCDRVDEPGPAPQFNFF